MDLTSDKEYQDLLRASKKTMLRILHDIKRDLIKEIKEQTAQEYMWVIDTLDTDLDSFIKSMEDKVYDL